MPKTTPPELQGQTHLVRTVAATLDIAVPSEREKKFRGTLLRKAAAEIESLKPALIVRLYEAACGVEFADDDVATFREICQRALAKHLDLSAHKLPATQ